MNYPAFAGQSRPCQPSFRLSISVAKLDMYQVDAIINLIAATQVPYHCNAFCGKCNIYAAYIRRYNPATPECIEIVNNREWRLTYLCSQLIKAIDRGLFQSWKSDLTESLEPPISRPCERLVYRDYKWWTNQTYLFAEDLARFCAYEKIELNIVDYSHPGPANVEANVLSMADASGIFCNTQNGVVQGAKSDVQVMASAESCQKKCQASSVAKTQEQPATTTDSGNNDSPTHAYVKVKQRRFDKIGAEIDEIMTNSPTLTPTQVMAVLIGRAGSQNSCVVANDGDSIRWENVSGKKVALTQDMLNDRVRRWHIAYDIAAHDEKS